MKLNTISATSIVAYLMFIGFLFMVNCNMATCMSLTDLENVRKTLLVNVSFIDIPSSDAGYFFAHGSNAVPLIVSGTTPVVMAATFNSDANSGKICAFGHNGYSETSSLNSSLGNLLVNCVDNSYF